MDGQLTLDPTTPPPTAKPTRPLETPGSMGYVTVARAREWLREQLEEGAQCPCCEQHAQEYRWSLYATAARLLVAIYRAGGTEEFVETKKHKGIGQGDASRLRLWGLAEQEKERRADGGRSGWWRVTELGEAFILGAATIPKYAYVYDGRLLRTEGDPTTIRDVLGVEFNYDDVVHWAA